MYEALKIKKIVLKTVQSRENFITHLSGHQSAQRAKIVILTVSQGVIKAQYTEESRRTLKSILPCVSDNQTRGGNEQGGRLATRISALAIYGECNLLALHDSHRRRFWPSNRRTQSRELVGQT